RRATKDRMWDLSLSPRSIGRIRELMQKERRFDPAVNRFLNRLSTEGRAWCTFDSDVAQSLDNLPFIDVSHPLIRVAFEDAKKSFPGDPFARVGHCRIAHANVPEGAALLFLYRLAVTGTEPQDTILAIGMTFEGKVLDQLGDELLGRLFLSEEGVSPMGLERGSLEKFEEIALFHADSKRQTAEAWAHKTDSARRATQITSINRSYDGRISRKQELGRRVLDDRILRLYEGEIRNLQAAKAAKLAEIEQAPPPFAELDLLAITFIEKAQ
ncbi:MAG TPA: hypothetical protein VH951_00770, partial [Dehalococcoidia bacterium]